MKISEITRRDILDALLVSVEGDQIYGRLEELEFLSRVWDLEAMPSTDARFDNAHGDIWQHTVNTTIGVMIGFPPTQGLSFLGATIVFS